MALCLLNLPSLAFFNVAEMMDYQEKFYISLLSKKSRNFIKSALKSNKPYSLMISLDNQWTVKHQGLPLLQVRAQEKEFDVEGTNRVLGRDKVLLEVHEPSIEGVSRVMISCRKHKHIRMSILEHFKNLLSNCRFKIQQIDFRDFARLSNVVSRISNLRNLMKNLEIPLAKIEYCQGFGKIDDVIQTVLDHCRDVEKVVLSGGITDKFVYYITSLDRFNFKKISIEDCQPFPRIDDVIVLFGNCEKVRFPNTLYSDEDLHKLVQFWIQDQKFMEFRCGFWNDTFSEKSMTDILKGVTSIPVKKARVLGGVHNFIGIECYQIQKTNGTSALIFRKSAILYLETNFEIVADDVETDEDSDGSYATSDEDE